MSTELAADLAGVLSDHLERPVGVAELRRLAGGSSHETWGFLATGDAAEPLPLVLRREFSTGLLETDVRAEYELLRALRDAGVPVPDPLMCVTEDSPLGLPFMVMERVAGTDVRKDLAHRDPARDLPALAERAVVLQARIHDVDPARVPGLEPEWGPAHEVQRWAAVIEASKPDPEPLLATALAWLRGNLPTPERACLVHGDFKANNLLISPGGDLTIIDWEMTHLGDPVEDLAWTMLWRTDSDVVGGLYTEAAYVEAYTRVTGRQVDPESLRFWRVFALTKLWAIFLTGMAGAHVRPSLRMMGRATVWLADQVAQQLLEVMHG